MQAQYPLKVQAIRSKGTKERLYVYLPIPLAAAIGLSAGEEVHWELLDRAELRLVRNQPPPPSHHSPPPIARTSQPRSK
jgi:hypothetical protein